MKVNDRASFNELVETFVEPLYRFAYQFVQNEDDAADITQDTFLKAWLNRKKYDPSKSIKTWLLSIAKNTALDFLKKKKNIPFSAFENEAGENTIESSIPDEELLPPELFERAERTAELVAALKKLAPQYRVVLFMHYTEGYTFQEIADILREPIDTIKSRNRRGLILLKDFFAPKTSPQS